MHSGLTGILAAFAAVALAGCINVHLTASDLLSPDEPPASARLPSGYIIEEALIERGDRIIGITRAHRDGNRVVIVFCGGDAFHRSAEGGSVLTALAQSADVVLFDYPGYGPSTGTPSTASILDNARAVDEYTARLPTSNGQKRVLYGFSLGGVVAAQLAGERPVAGLVLEATTTSVGSWARTRIPWFAKPFVRVGLDPDLAGIDNVAALAKFRGSVLVLAGGRDKRAPPVLSHGLAKGLKGHGVRVKLREFSGAAHGKIYRETQFQSVLDQFLASL